MHRIQLDFRIFDAPLDAIEELEINATKIYIKGQPAFENSKILSTHNTWVLDSEIGDSAIIENHLSSLESKIKPKLNAFAALCQNYESEFSCVLYIDSQSEESIPAIHFSNSFNKLVADLNATIDVDIYLL